MQFTINEKSYDTENLTPAQNTLFQKILLATTIGDMINIAHENYSTQLGSSLEDKSDVE
jgi:hypothetical protein